MSCVLLFLWVVYDTQWFPITEIPQIYVTHDEVRLQRNNPRSRTLFVEPKSLKQVAHAVCWSIFNETICRVIQLISNLGSRSTFGNDDLAIFWRLCIFSNYGAVKEVAQINSENNELRLTFSLSCLRHSVVSYYRDLADICYTWWGSATKE